jgi:hypothetical protein
MEKYAVRCPVSSLWFLEALLGSSFSGWLCFGKRAGEDKKVDADISE